MTGLSTSPKLALQDLDCNLLGCQKDSLISVLGVTLNNVWICKFVCCCDSCLPAKFTIFFSSIDPLHSCQTKYYVSSRHTWAPAENMQNGNWESRTLKEKEDPKMLVAHCPSHQDIFFVFLVFLTYVFVSADIFGCIKE